MVNPQLLAYIKAQLAAGVAKADLIKSVAAAGWAAQDSTDTFAAAEGRAPVVPPPPPPVQQAPLTRPVSQLTAQPIQAVSVTRTRERTLWPWALVVAILVVAGGVYAAYAYVPGMRDIVGLYLGTAQPAPVLEPIVAPTTETYTDTMYGFSFTYPNDLSVTLGAGPNDAVAAVQNTISSTTQEGFSVLVESGKQALSLCMRPPLPGGNTSTTVLNMGTTTLQGVPYTSFALSDNTPLRITYYQTIHDNLCYTLDYQQRGDLGGAARLAEVAQSFTFIATSTTASASSTVQ